MPSSGFIEALKELGPDGHWLDGGSGDGIAIGEYVDPDKANGSVRILNEMLQNIIKNPPGNKEPETEWKVSIEKQLKIYTDLLKLIPSGAKGAGVTLEMQRTPSPKEENAKYLGGR